MAGIKNSKKDLIGRVIIVAVIIGLLIKTLFFAQKTEFWDFSVYYGMGKYIFSYGSDGLWEPLRPLFWPVIVGMFWKAGFSIIAIKTFGVLLSLANVLLVYEICKKLHSKKTAILASVITLLSITTAFYESKGLSEIPAVFFSLLAVKFWIEEKYVKSGVLTGISFAAKFTQGIIFIPLALLLAKKPSRMIEYSLSFTAIIISYLTINSIIYQNPLLPFSEASKVIEYSGSWRDFGMLYFFKELLKENIFFIFAIPAVINIFIERKKEKMAIASIAVLLIAYFAQLMHKEARFFMLFVPFLAILSAEGMRKTKLKKSIIVILIVIFTANYFYGAVGYWNYSGIDKEVQERFYNYKTNETIMASSPIFTFYINKKIELLYYPVFDDKIKDLSADKLENYTVAINTCDIPCKEKECEEKKKKFLTELIKREKINLQKNGCRYYIFE